MATMLKSLFRLMTAVAFAGVALGAAGREAPLADAVERGEKATVASLLKKGADVNAAQSDGATALHWAAYNNDAETTAALLKAGAKANVKNDLGVTPLALAAQQGGAAV